MYRDYCNKELGLPNLDIFVVDLESIVFFFLLCLVEFAIVIARSMFSYILLDLVQAYTLAIASLLCASSLGISLLAIVKALSNLKA